MGSRARNVTLTGILLCLTTVMDSSAQTPQFEQRRLCELLMSPLRYSGRLISVRAEVLEAREMILVDPNDHSCGRVPSAFPESRDVRPRPQFTLSRDENFEALLRALPELLPKPSGARGRIFATFEGRFDFTPSGSGHLGLHSSRFVIRRVLNVEVMSAP
jgi:hypothetical protein